MKILVTGSAGFIGRHVCDLLFQRGHTVQGIDAYLPQVHGHRYAASYGARSWEWRMTVGNAAHWGSARIWDEFDAVIHLAAEVGVAQSMYEPARYVNANTLDTVKLWERVVKHKNIRKFIQASSMSVYGEGAYSCVGYDRTVSVPIPTPETKLPEPASVYARTKLDQECYSLLLGQTYKVPTVALRFFGTYGEGQSLSNPYTGVAAIFACRVLNGKPPLVFEDGLQRRDFIHVSDVAKAVVAAVELPSVEGVFNVGTGTPTTVLALAQGWCNIAAQRGFPAVQPKVLNQSRAGDIRHCTADITKIEQAFGWRPQVNIRDGLGRLADWIIANNFHKQLPDDKTDTAIQELVRAGLVK